MDQIVSELSVAEAELAKTPPEVVRSAQRMLDSADLLISLSADLGAVGICGEVELGVAQYLVATSRMLSKPMAAYVQGPSSAGKSHAIDCVAKLIPPEAKITATSLTPQALFYTDDGYLRHKVVFAGERSRQKGDDVAEATRALREMISSGRLSKLVPVGNGENRRSQLIEKDGPIAYIESTTLRAIFTEDANRMLPLHVDTSQAQTRRVLSAIGQMLSGAECATDGAAEAIARHHAAQRLLLKQCQSVRVVIPYAGRLAELFPTDHLQARRALPHVLAAIQACAMLHCFSRSTDDEGRLIAGEDDYRIVQAILDMPVARQLHRSSRETAIRRYEQIHEHFGDDQTFTVLDVAGKLGTQERSQRTHINELCELGMLVPVEDAAGRKGGRWKLAPWSEHSSGSVLPPADSVCRQADNAQVIVATEDLSAIRESSANFRQAGDGALSACQN